MWWGRRFSTPTRRDSVGNVGDHERPESHADIVPARADDGSSGDPCPYVHARPFSANGDTGLHDYARFAAV
jgi:hypothetical protein